MDETTISFIIYTENQIDLFKCKSFISNLILPDGVTKEIIAIDNAFCIANAYNIGMNLSKGKYKVYVKESLFITNPNFIREILNIFKNNEIGLIGLAGSKYSSLDLDWKKSSYIFGSMFYTTGNDMLLKRYKTPTSSYEDVTFISSSLFATQYDIPWQEDLFDGYHLYDYAQCFEFLRAKKKVVVPKQAFPWAIDDSKLPNMEYYDFYKQLFLNEYSIDIKNNMEN